MKNLLKKFSHTLLTRDKAHTLAVLCASMAVLIGVAVFLGGRAASIPTLIAEVPPASQTASWFSCWWYNNCTYYARPAIYSFGADTVNYGNSPLISWSTGNAAAGCNVTGGQSHYDGEEGGYIWDFGPTYGGPSGSMYGLPLYGNSLPYTLSCYNYNPSAYTNHAEASITAYGNPYPTAWVSSSESVLINTPIGIPISAAYQDYWYFVVDGANVGTNNTLQYGSAGTHSYYLVSCTNAGYCANSSGTLTVNNPTCTNGLNYNQYPSCSCPGGQVQSGSSCITPSCPNGLDINQYPSCSCPQFYTQSGSSCVPPAGPAVNIFANPNPVSYNTVTTISWSASGGAGYDACYLGGGQWGGGVAVSTSGSTGTNALTSNTQYWYQCHDTYYGWQGPTYVTVTVSVPAAPSLSLSASPASVAYGSASTLSWSATNAGNIDSCTLSGGQWGGGTGVGASGSSGTGGLTQNTTYSFSCHDTYYGTLSPTTAAVAINAPTCSISSSPSTIYNGQPTTLTYSSSNATSASIDHGVGSVSTNGSSTAYPSTNTTYTMTASGPGGSNTCSTGVTVNSIPPTCTGSTCTFSCSPTTILLSQSTTCNWSCSSAVYTSSQGDSNYSTGGTLLGNKTLTPAGNATYSVSCIAPGGTTVGSASITVLAPILSLTASPSRVQKGKTTTLTWSAQNITAGTCLLKDSLGSTLSSAASGSQVATVNNQTTYTLSCTALSGPQKQSVTVTLIPAYQEI